MQFDCNLGYISLSCIISILNLAVSETTEVKIRSLSGTAYNLSVSDYKTSPILHPWTYFSAV